MRRYVVASVFLILGLLAIIAKTELGVTHWFYPYLDQLPGVFLVSGTLSLMHKALEEREQDKRLRDLFRIHDSIDRMGLTEILFESQAFNYTDLLERSIKFAVVMNDGHRWVGNYLVKLRERFGRDGTTTEVFLVDPDSEFAGVLASKIGTTKTALAEKIRTTHKLLQDSHAEAGKKGELKIYSLKNYPSFAVFLATNNLLLRRIKPPRVVRSCLCLSSGSNRGARFTRSLKTILHGCARSPGRSTQRSEDIVRRHGQQRAIQLSTTRKHRSNKPMVPAATPSLNRYSLPSRRRHIGQPFGNGVRGATWSGRS